METKTNNLNMTDKRSDNIRLHEDKGFKVVHNFTEVTVMEHRGKFIKIDSDGEVSPFKPLFT